MIRINYLLFAVLFLCGLAFSNNLLASENDQSTNEGLIAWWNFDEPDGRAVADASGNNADAVLYRQVHRLGGVSGRCVYFSGQGHHAEIINTTSLSPTEQITISSWVCGTGINVIYYSKSHTLKMGYKVVEFGLSLDKGYFMLTVPTELSLSNDRKWHLVAATYDGSMMRAYIDGVEIGSLAATGKIKPLGDSPVSLGALALDDVMLNAELTEDKVLKPITTDSLTSQFTLNNSRGCLDDIRVYNRALTAEEMFSLYNSISPEVLSDSAKAIREFEDRHRKSLNREKSKLLKENRINRTKPIDLSTRAKWALDGFMSKEPILVEGTDGHYRTLFCASITPIAVRGKGQWDFGDCTARAVEEWFFAREMTGDLTTGKKIQTGQENFLLSMLHPETGLVYVPTFSDKEKDSYYYHSWDQGRTMRALVRWYIARPEERKKIKPLIDRMIQGMDDLATVRGNDPNWGPYAGWLADVYTNDKPGGVGGGWVWMRVGLFVEPIAMYAEFTGDKKALDTAIRFANCNIGGNSPGDPAKCKFRSDGGFDGHLHTKTAFLVGLAKLGKYLVAIGRVDEGKRYIHAARKSYDWLFTDAGGAYRNGWVPEHPGVGSSEICCIADTIELAEALAACAEIGPEFYDWADLHGDVEAMVVNVIAASQMKFTPQFQKWLEEFYRTYSPDVTLDTAIAKTFDGVSSSCFGYNDLSREKIHCGGCCRYSGVRALYAGWHDAIKRCDGAVYINYFINRNSEYVSMTTTQPVKGQAEIDILEKTKVFVRVPEYLKVGQMNIQINGRKIKSLNKHDVTGRYIALGKLDKGDKINVTFPMVPRVENWRGHTVKWRGNYVVAMDPQGGVLPLFPSAESIK